MNLIVADLKSIDPSLSSVNFVSDGAASQFKNRFILSSLVLAERDLGVKAQWNFFPTSHGKSPADGLGGTFKRGVESRVLSGKFQVYTAKDFITCAKTFGKETKLYCVSDDQMRSTTDELKKRWARSKALNGSRAMHHFQPSADGKCLIAAVTSKLDGRKFFKNID